MSQKQEAGGGLVSDEADRIETARTFKVIDHYNKGKYCSGGNPIGIVHYEGLPFLSGKCSSCRSNLTTKSLTSGPWTTDLR